MIVEDDLTESDNQTGFKEILVSGKWEDNEKEALEATLDWPTSQSWLRKRCSENGVAKKAQQQRRSNNGDVTTRRENDAATTVQQQRRSNNGAATTAQRQRRSDNGAATARLEFSVHYITMDFVHTKSYDGFCAHKIKKQGFQDCL